MARSRGACRALRHDTLPEGEVHRARATTLALGRALTRVPASGARSRARESVILAADWVITTTGALAGAWVSVRDGAIEWIGPARGPGAPAGDVLELGHGVLLPGLVNAHCHLELTHLAGRVDASGGFVRWVEGLVEARPRATAEEIDAGIARGIEQAVAAGTAVIADVSNTLRSIRPLASSSLRAVVLHELLGWDPSASGTAIADAERRIADLGGPRPASNVEVRLAAHAPHSVSPELLRAMVGRGGPAAIHLAESREESAFLATGDGEWSAFLGRRGLGHVPFSGADKSPIAYLDGLGALRRGMVCAHCVQADAADCRLLAARGASVVLCPRSNRTLGVGRAPVEDLLEAGVTCALGTDSLASAPSLDLLQDAAALHRDWPAVPPAHIVRMATIDGARALGLDRIGGIEVGWAAALAFAPGPARLRDPHAYLVSGEAAAQPVAAGR